LLRTILLPLVCLSSFAHAAPEALSTGGMWMPQQMLEQAEVLKQLGIQLDAAQLSDPASHLMKAIISMGYCSGSFISKSGLIITNHHCAQKILSYLTKEDLSNGVKSDFSANGFSAKSLGEERNGGPTERIFITQKFVDVTDIVRAGIEKIKDPLKRYEEMERRRLALVAKSEKGRPEIRAEVVSFFRGEKVYLIEKLEIKDVRLVFAPPTGIGFFGGDDDNWQWPRQTGDFSVLRAYVGKDGKPAPYSPDNVPYVPDEILKVSTKGLIPGDAVFAAGYPGSTERLDTRDEVAFTVNTSLPWRIKTMDLVIKAIDELGKRNEDDRLKVEDKRKGMMNGLQNSEQSLEALKKIDFLAMKEKSERELREWLAADSSRGAKFGDFLSEIEKLNRDADANFQSNVLQGWTPYLASLFSSALRIVKMADQRKKADADRESGFQVRDWDRVRESERSLQKSYSRTVDTELLTLIANLALQDGGRSMPWLSSVIDFNALDKGVDVKSQIEAVYSKSKLEDVETRIQLFNNGTPESLRADPDPLLQLALRFFPYSEARDEEAKVYAAKMTLVSPRYIQALRGERNGHLAPDANSTLRVTIGKVQGYRDTDTGVYHRPFTNFSQMEVKAQAHGFKFPYEAPKAMLDEAHKGSFGEYGDERFGEISVNFLNTLDITGGNSGSATMDKEGNLVGLMFDGTSQSLYSDWVYGDDTRAIAVDIRYALWIMDHIYGQKRLIDEMTLVKPVTCNTELAISVIAKK
jgi:hypothetical protein